LKRLLKIIFKNNACNAIASTFLTLKLIRFATNIEVATIHKRELCVIKNVFAKDKKQLESHQELIRI